MFAFFCPSETCIQQINSFKKVAHSIILQHVARTKWKIKPALWCTDEWPKHSSCGGRVRKKGDESNELMNDSPERTIFLLISTIFLFNSAKLTSFTFTATVSALASAFLAMSTLNFVSDTRSCVKTEGDIDQTCAIASRCYSKARGNFSTLFYVNDVAFNFPRVATNS